MVVVKIGLKLCRESWRIVILRVCCVAGKSSFSFFSFSLIFQCVLKWFFRLATGGSIPNLLPRLSDAELNVTQSINNTGNVSVVFNGFHLCV